MNDLPSWAMNLPGTGLPTTPPEETLGEPMKFNVVSAGKTVIVTEDGFKVTLGIVVKGMYRGEPAANNVTNHRADFEVKVLEVSRVLDELPNANVERVEGTFSN